MSNNSLGSQRYFRKVSVEKHGIEFTMVDFLKCMHGQIFKVYRLI